jgi:hypothetical protein
LHCSSSGYCSVWIPVVVMQQPIFYNTQHVADSEQTVPASTHSNNEQVVANSSSQIAPLRWYVREKEICPRECRARSPSFAMTLPEHPTDISFSLMIDPYLSRRFRQPAYGSIKVKCESDLKKMIHCTKTQITVHVGGEIRGPFIHDFSSIAVFELPRGQDKWNLTAAVDATSKCIPIMVQVVPMPSAVSCSGCVSDVVDSASADSSHADSSENQCQDDLQSDSGSQWIGDARHRQEPCDEDPTNASCNESVTKSYADAFRELPSSSARLPARVTRTVDQTLRAQVKTLASDSTARPVGRK